MSKKEWRRVSLADLADRKIQKRVLGNTDQAKGHPAPDSPEKRGHESPQVKR